MPVGIRHNSAIGVTDGFVSVARLHPPRLDSPPIRFCAGALPDHRICADTIFIRNQAYQQQAHLPLALHLLDAAHQLACHLRFAQALTLG